MCLFWLFLLAFWRSSWGVSQTKTRWSPALPRRKRRCVLLAQTWWEDRVLRGVADYASAHNWELQCRMHWTHQLPALGEWRGDGIIAYAGISRSQRTASRRLAALVRATRVPVVDTQTFGDYFHAPKVIVPHEAIGRMAAAHFLSLNFRHVGFVAFDENLLEFHALTPRSLARTIARLPRPMALLAANDPNALEVIMRCRDAGFRVPEEFAVMGIDDTAIVCDLAGVPLTSINCNYERQGYEAAALLDRLMDGKPRPAGPVLVQPQGVTVRRSTDTVARPGYRAGAPVPARPLPRAARDPAGRAAARGAAAARAHVFPRARRPDHAAGAQPPARGARKTPAVRRQAQGRGRRTRERFLQPLPLRAGVQTLHPADAQGLPPRCASAGVPLSAHRRDRRRRFSRLMVPPL
jgi:LacI family transcriptional regulator